MKNKMYIYNMKSYEHEVYIAHTLKYIHFNTYTLKKSKILKQMQYQII